MKIASEYNMRIGLRILVFLGQNLKMSGEEEFMNAWKQEIAEDPPLKKSLLAFWSLRKQWRSGSGKFSPAALEGRHHRPSD